MAKLVNDKIVTAGEAPALADTAELKRISAEKSPVSERDPEKYAKGK